MRKLLFLLALAIITGGCAINKNLMFKTPEGYTYESFPDSARHTTYKITDDDQLEFRLFTNQGFKLIDLSTINGQGAQNNYNRQNQLLYPVDIDGTVKLPTLGRVYVRGLTIREAEKKLEQMYSEYYKGAFVLLYVRNNRVIVSPGGGGNAQVVTLTNNNTTLLEVLAQAGGVDNRGNASHIKLIRMDQSGQRHIYEFDLSTISGVKDADIPVQANDIIYVQPLPQIASELVKNMAPYISLLTSVVLVLGVLRLR